MRILLLAMLVGCTSPAQSTGIQAVSCPSSSDLTYANYGKAFIADTCLSCHAGRDNPNLSTQSSVQLHLGEILDRAVYTDAMPQNGALTTDERTLLGEWLACGAP